MNSTTLPGPAQKITAPHKLLTAAASLFAEKGYHATSVREITQQAGLNAAAINYHYGDKAGLYRQVLEQALKEMPPLSVPADVRDLKLDLPVRVRALVHAVMATMHENLQGCARKLFVHEELKPSGVLGPLLSELIRPKHEALVREVASLAGSSEHDSRVHHVVKTLVNAIKGYSVDKDSLGFLSLRVFGAMTYEDQLEVLTEQLVDLIAGVRARRAGGTA